MSFKHLFTPHEMRGLEIRNRIFSSAHQTILARNDRKRKLPRDDNEATSAKGELDIAMD